MPLYPLFIIYYFHPEGVPVVLVVVDMFYRFTVLFHVAACFRRLRFDYLLRESGFRLFIAYAEIYGLVPLGPLASKFAHALACRAYLSQQPPQRIRLRRFSQPFGLDLFGID